MSQVFTQGYFVELSVLELHHDSLPGVTEVRRRELQRPLRSVTNDLPLAIQGEKQFLNRNTAPAILAKIRMNGLEMSPRAAFSFIYFTYNHYIFLSSLRHCFTVSSIAPVIICLIQMYNERNQRKDFVCGQSLLSNSQINMFLEILHALLYKESK